MNDARKYIDILCKEITMNKITCDDISKRLTVAIETEYLKEKPNIDFINACEDCLWELGTQGQQKFASVNQRYIIAIQQATKRRSNPFSSITLFRRCAAITCAILLIIGGGKVFSHCHWFLHTTTQNGEIYIIRGHEITVDLIQTALADHETHTYIKTHDFNELCGFVGFSPSVIRPEALSAVGATYYAHVESGLIILDTLYHGTSGDSIAVLKIEYYIDPEEAYLMLQQDLPGDYITINGHSIYFSTNMERQSFVWLDGTTLTTLSGHIGYEQGVSIIEQLTRRITHE